MISDANPQDSIGNNGFDSKQTIEMRSPDGSADLYHLFAGLVMAAQYGIEMPDALSISRKLYVDVNICITCRH